MDLEEFMKKYSSKDGGLRTVETLSKRLDNCMKESERGFSITLDRNEAILVAKLLDGEIGRLRGMK